MIDAGEVQAKAVDACRSYLALPHFNRVGATTEGSCSRKFCKRKMSFPFNRADQLSLAVPVTPLLQEAMVKKSAAAAGLCEW